MKKRKTDKKWLIVIGTVILSMMCGLGYYWKEQRMINYEEAIEIAVRDTGLDQNSAHISCMYNEECQEYKIMILNNDYTQKYEYTISEKKGTIKQKYN